MCKGCGGCDAHPASAVQGNHTRTTADMDVQNSKEREGASGRSGSHNMEELEQPSIFSLRPVNYALQLVTAYGWWLVAGVVAALYAANALQPRLQRWRQQREDGAYHKDPDVELRRMEAIQRAREKQQEQLAAASVLQAEKEKEREERKRAEAAQRVGAAGSSTAGGSRLGTREDYLPLSGGGGASGGYRPPKKSKCGGGGCGR